MASFAPLENFDHHLRRRIGPDKKVAFISGNFNILHPGHLRLLKFGADNADVLVVGVNPDSTPGVSVPAEVRVEGLQAVTFVDHIVLLDEPAHDFIAKLKPEIVVKGKEHETHDNRELPIVEAYGGKLLFTSGETQFSSIELLEREYFEVNYSAIKKPVQYPVRHNFQISELKQLCSSLAGIRVLVVGDLITDTYVDCDPLGMSQEDPTVVVTPIESKMFVGGAGIVAAHARGLGADVTLLTVSGRDSAFEFASRELTNYGVNHELLHDVTRPTTNKVRYRAHGKTLLRLNELRQHSIEHKLVDEMKKRIEARLPETDLLLFADFNYGCLPQGLVDFVIDKAKARGIMLAADSQASSQLSNICRFKGMNLITPTEREARLALRDLESGLVILSEELRKTSQAENVLLTLGAEGLLMHANENGAWHTDRLPAFNTAPKDAAGAGDCLFTCTALSLCAGADIWRSTYLGSLATAHQVSRVGNKPIKVDELIAEIDYPLE